MAEDASNTILAGELMNAGGISRRIINMAQAYFGHKRGGLGYVAIAASVLLASMSELRHAVDSELRQLSKVAPKLKEERQKLVEEVIAERAKNKLAELIALFEVQPTDTTEEARALLCGAA